jgi:hypothetical protein
MTLFSTADNNFGVAKYTVDPQAGEGTHTTIATAIATAGAGPAEIFIRPGTYTENVTLAANINLTAFGADSSLNGTGLVIISGTITKTSAGTSTISGIQLQTNSAALLAVTGSAASVVNLNNCYLNCTNNTGITYSSSSATSGINISNCSGNLGTTGIGLYAHSSAGLLNIYYTKILNTGASVTSSTNSAGTTQLSFSDFRIPFTNSSTNSFMMNNSNIDTSTQNTIALTIGSTFANALLSTIESGSASAISISGTCAVYLCEINSTNTNAITGAGTLTYAGLTFGNTSVKINTTTQIGGLLQGGVTQAPSPGFIGEQLKSVVSGVSIVTSSVTQNLTSLVLSAGIWDMVFQVEVTATAGTSLLTAISTASATLGTPGDSQLGNISAFTATSLTISGYRAIVTAPATYFGTLSVAFTGTSTGYGRLCATRVA